MFNRVHSNTPVCSSVFKQLQRMCHVEKTTEKPQSAADVVPQSAQILTKVQRDEELDELGGG